MENPLRSQFFEKSKTFQSIIGSPLWIYWVSRTAPPFPVCLCLVPIRAIFFFIKLKRKFKFKKNSLWYYFANFSAFKNKRMYFFCFAFCFVGKINNFYEFFKVSFYFWAAGNKKNSIPFVSNFHSAEINWNFFQSQFRFSGWFERIPVCVLVVRWCQFFYASFRVQRFFGCIPGANPTRKEPTASC